MGNCRLYADQLADMDEECEACVTLFRLGQVRRRRTLGRWCPTGQAALALGASVK